MNNKSKKIIIVLLILTIIFTLVGVTLAYWSWNSSIEQRTDLAFTVKPGYSCGINGNSNITSQELNIVPSSCNNAEHAIIRQIEIVTKTTEKFPLIYLDLWLDINELGIPLSESTNFSYAISKNNNNCDNPIKSGNFFGLGPNSKINLLEQMPYSKNSTDTYYLYIWLDKAEENPNTANQPFDLSLNGNCTGEESKDIFKIEDITINKNKVTISTTNKLNIITDYAITTTDTEPDNWISSNLTEENGNVFNMEHIVSGNGTYYVWFRDNENNIISQSFEVTGLEIYTITYELNEGTHASEYPTEYIYGVGVELKEPTKIGHTFKGWYTDSNFTTEAITSISTTQTGNITLYAKWEVNTYTITYHLNGGTLASGSPTSYTYGVGATLINPTRTGHNFTGWYTETEAITSISTTQTGNVTLTAMWYPKNYSINYTLNGGTLASGSPTNYTYGADVTLKNPTRTGYTFKGWYYSSSFTGTAVTKISSGTTGNITLYAKWEANTYSIVYYLDGGTHASGYPTRYTYGVGVTLKNPQKSGYSFQGWYTDSSFSGEKVTSISATQTGTVRLYAKWKKSLFG